ncbi:MAG TPA: hypothetical protein VIC71_05150 [Gammaproteobacteria bacterium]|jgi:hypothetical protein
MKPLPLYLLIGVSSIFPAIAQEGGGEGPSSDEIARQLDSGDGAGRA